MGLVVLDEAGRIFAKHRCKHELVMRTVEKLVFLGCATPDDARGIVMLRTEEAPPPDATAPAPAKKLPVAEGVASQPRLHDITAAQFKRLFAAWDRRGRRLSLWDYCQRSMSKAAPPLGKSP